MDRIDYLRFGDENEEFTSVAFSPDGARLLACGNRELRVWDVASGDMLMRVAGARGGSPVFSSDGKRVAATQWYFTPMAGYLTRSFGVWDVASGKLLHSLDSSKELPWPMAIALDRGLTASRDGKGITIRGLDTGETVCTYTRPTGYVAEFAFSPDGSLLASSARDGSIRLLAVSTGKVLADFQTQAAGWTSIAFSPDGKKLLSGGGAAVLELRDISQFHRVAQAAAAEAAAAQVELPKVEASRSVPPPKKPAPQPTDFEPLFQRIDNAREAGKLVKSSVAGGKGGGPFESALDEPTLLVGFDYTLSTFYGGHLTVKSVRPIYVTRKGETLGKWHGVPHGKVHRVRAKAGYVVTALVARHGHRLDGMRLIYMRVKDGRINPDDTYRSKWIGGHGGGRETLVATYGDPIVSIFGRQGHDLDAIGFVQIDTE